jgi:hypothetical protein
VRYLLLYNGIEEPFIILDLSVFKIQRSKKACSFRKRSATKYDAMTFAILNEFQFALTISLGRDKNAFAGPQGQHYSWHECMPQCNFQLAMRDSQMQQCVPILFHGLNACASTFHKVISNLPPRLAYCNGCGHENPPPHTRTHCTKARDEKKHCWHSCGYKI